MTFTGIPKLDSFFNNTIPCGILIDIFGPSGIGKTQLAMQILLHAVSKNKQILFQDTTGAFRPERIAEMAQQKNLDIELLNDIYVSRITNVSEQINSLFDAHTSKFPLIIIDDISDLFSFEYSNSNQFFKKNKIFFKYMKNLSSFANENNTTILFINTMRVINDVLRENHQQIIDVFTHVKVKLAKIDQSNNQCTCFTAFDKIQFNFAIQPSGLVEKS